MNIIWVATNGNDTTGDGSEMCPYLTISRAIATFSDGDQIRIKDGVYAPTDTISILGSGGDGSFVADNPGEVTIQPSIVSSTKGILFINNFNHFTLRGIIFHQASDPTDNDYGIIAENIYYLLCDYCGIVNFSSSGDIVGIQTTNCRGTINRCTISDISAIGPTFCAIQGKYLDIIDCTVARITGSATTTVTVSDQTTDIHWPGVRRLIVIDYQTLQLNFDDFMDTSTFQAGFFTIDGDNSAPPSNAAVISDQCVRLTANILHSLGHYVLHILPGVRDTNGIPIDPGLKDIPFIAAFRPSVSNVTVVNKTHLDVSFDDFMNTTDGELDKAANYTFDDPTVTASNAAILDAITVRLTVAGMMGDSTYTLRVQNVKDDFTNNLIEPNGERFTFVTVAPRVIGAVATNYKTVQVSFNKEMDVATFLPGNFTIVDAAVTSAHDFDDYTAELEAVELHSWVTYTGEALPAVTDTQGWSVSPLFDTFTFNAVWRPGVTTALLSDARHIVVIFDSNMFADADLVAPANYVVTGPSAVTTLGVVRLDATSVSVFVSPMNAESTYTITVSNVKDTFFNVIDLDKDDATFVTPELPRVVSIDALTLILEFDTPMQNNAALTTPGNYAITGSGSPIVSTVTYVDPTHVQLDIPEIEPEEDYIVEVSNVESTTGDPLDPAHDTASWTAGWPQFPNVVSHVNLDGGELALKENPFAYPVSLPAGPPANINSLASAQTGYPVGKLYRYLGLTSGPEGLTKMTVSIWAKCRVASDAAMVAMWDRMRSRYSWVLTFGGTSTCSLTIRGIDSKNYTSLTWPVGVGVWNFIAGTFNGVNGEMSIYANGVQRTTTTTYRGPTNSPSCSHMTLGGTGYYVDNTHWWVENSFQDYIDELIIWNGVLTKKQLDYMYNSGNGRPYPF